MAKSRVPVIGQVIVRPGDGDFGGFRNLIALDYVTVGWRAVGSISIETASSCPRWLFPDLCSESSPVLPS